MGYWILDIVLFLTMRLSTGFHIIFAIITIHFLGAALGDESEVDLWAIDHNNTALCHERHICTPSHRRWSINSTLFFENDACDVLTKKGIKRIWMMGDSYMRHIYIAFLMTVSGNYHDDPLIRSDKTCEYRMLFNEKRCSTSMLQGEISICSDQITLFSSVLPDKSEVGDLILMSEGNHNINDRWDAINNASAYINHYFYSNDSLCAISGPPSITIWISTHARIAATNNFETAARVKLYNEQMKDFILSGRCGPIEYIDVYNMTSDLKRHHRADAYKMAFDKAHWGMEVNLAKAQMILTEVNENPSVSFVH
jgi:hypothetical protein